MNDEMKKLTDNYRLSWFTGLRKWAAADFYNHSEWCDEYE